MFRLLSLCWLVVLLCAAASGASRAADSTPNYYLDSARGWSWYEDPPPPAPQKPEPPPPTPGSGSGAPLAPLSAEWFRAKLPVYRDAAIDDPSDANVARYLYLQRIAMDKADAFKNSAQRVVMNYPGLDEDQRTPQSAVVKATARQISRDTTQKVMRRLAASAGLWYFFRSDCPYCHAQAPILGMLQQSYGFRVLPISLDGLPTPDGYYPDFRSDQGQAAKLGVRVTPSLFLITHDGKILQLAEGLQTLASLEDRVFAKGRDAGLVTEAEYNAVMWRANQTLVDALPPNLTSEITDDSAAFTALLRAAAMEGDGTPATASSARTHQ